MTLLLVALGGAGGALARYLVTRWVKARTATPLPLATLGVNLAGCLLLGLLTGSGGPGSARLLLGTGGLGGFTTFSTLEWECAGLLTGKRGLAAVLCLVLGWLGGAALAGAGYCLGRGLFG